MKKNAIKRRSEKKDKLNFRTLSVRLSTEGKPATMDEDSRSVEVIVATEEPTEVFDYNRWEIVPEILLMDGAELPNSRQIPLLDSHFRGSTSSVLGSVRGLKADDGELTGRAYFSGVEEAAGPWTKVREGHITDISVGYRVIGEPVWIPEGETAKVKGRDFRGPVSVVTRWRPKEASIVAIGADQMATVRGEASQKPFMEEPKVNEKLRKFLEKRGLAEDASEEDAWAFLAKLDLPKEQREDLTHGNQPPESTPEVDVEKIRKEAQGQERERIREIDAMCAGFDVPADMSDRFIAEGTSLDEARKAVLDWLKNKSETSGGTGFRTMILEDERDKFRDAATDSIFMRSAPQFRPEKPAAGANDLMGFSLKELARHALYMAGKPVKGNPLEMVGRALITTDLPLIMANVANKALFVGFETAPETWSTWCGTGSAADFKTNYLPRISESSDLDEIPEHGEYKYGKLAEKQESYQLATYGKLFAITRQAIINDDLGALTDTPARHGEAAARKVGDVAYAVLTANGTMGDGLALFEATYHKNLVAAGSGAAPGISTIAAGILAMGVQKDLQGLRRLNLRPEYYISPKALEGAAEIFFRSERFSDHSTVATDSSFASQRVNPYAGAYFTRVYDSRLDDNDPAAWFLAAMRGKTINVYFLNGIQTPYMETKQGWSVDGVEYKVRIDVAAKAVDYRGLYMNDGN